MTTTFNDRNIKMENRKNGLWSKDFCHSLFHKPLFSLGVKNPVMEVQGIVQETVIKTISKKKKCKKAKWVSEEALQIAEKRREATGKGE